MSPDEIRMTELAEQRHALLDLDADAECTDYPGCVCVVCPPRLDKRPSPVRWECVAFAVGFMIGLILTMALGRP